MFDLDTSKVPSAYNDILEATKRSGFNMASDILTCSMLRTLAASKPNSRFLELGTGSGLSTSWILDGMDTNSSLISIDNDSNLLEIAESYLGDDDRLSLLNIDGEDWVTKHLDEQFDYIFADTWHGKYLLLEEVLNMVSIGGIYIIDDMLPQSNWPDGHDIKVKDLMAYLDKRADFTVTKLNWATGLIIAVRRE